jgi:flagellar biosynthetic protein FliQ
MDSPSRSQPVRVPVRNPREPSQPDHHYGQTVKTGWNYGKREQIRIMDAQWILNWSQEAIRLALIISLPILAVALLAGIVMGLIQTIMQLNDAAVGQIPRMIVVCLAVLMLMPWMIDQWVGFTTGLISSVVQGP